MRDEDLTPEDSRHTSRRAFTKTIASAIVAAPLAARVAQAQTPPATTREPVAPPKPEPSPSPQRPQQPQTTPLGEAYGEVARVRFGDRLSPEELTRVKRAMEGKVRTGERLRTVKLQNSDEPDFVFSA